MKFSTFSISVLMYTFCGSIVMFSDEMSNWLFFFISLFFFFSRQNLGFLVTVCYSHLRVPDTKTSIKHWKLASDLFHSGLDSTVGYGLLHTGLEMVPRVVDGTNLSSGPVYVVRLDDSIATFIFDLKGIQFQEVKRSIAKWRSKSKAIDTNENLSIRNFAFEMSSNCSFVN